LEVKMKLLIGLQDCDIRIRDAQNKKKEKPIRIERLQKELDQSESQLKAELDQLELNRRARRGSEQEIEELENRIIKSNIKLNNIKSNKEYTAALKELADSEKEKTLMEDGLIEIMEQIETLEQKCVSNNTKGELLKEKFEMARDESLKELKALDEVLESLENKRADFCKAIDEGLLKRYDILRQNKEGLAISPVVKGICQACHMGIPPQKFNELIRGDALMSCPYCSRMIYWGEDERFKNINEKG
jgi:predicted  nucleic acid-binding Zn-ribbon protein